jgi:hypothetical protein
VLVEGAARSLQAGFDSWLACTKHGRHLSDVEREYVAQHQDGQLPGRHVLQADNEGKFDRLTGLVARLRGAGHRR